jgi:hypothetical protein
MPVHKASFVRHSWSVVALGLAAVTLPQATAQVTPQPLVVAPGGAPLDPARPTPLQGPRQPVAPGRASDAPIEVGVLNELDPSVVGLLDDPHGGLGTTMWQGTPRARVEALLPRMPMGTVSPVMQDLARRLLLTTALLPAGPPVAPTLLGLRVERLMAGGRIDEVNELLRVAAARVNDPALARADIDAMLLSGDFGGACQKVPALMLADPTPYWLKTIAFCRALDRDTAAVALATSLLRDQGHVGDEAFFVLIAALPADGGAPAVTTLVDPTPLHLAMLRAANQPVPADAVAGAKASILRVIATAPRADTTTVPREAIEAAERAESTGALDAATLADIYAAVSYTAAQIQDALKMAAREKGALTNALLYQAGQVWTDPSQRAQALQVAWTAAKAEGMFGTAARVNLVSLRQIAPSPELLEFAPHAARAALAAGDVALAWSWLELAMRQAGTITPQGANTQAISIAAQLWPLLQLADPEGARQRSSARTAAWWQELPRVSEGPEADKRALLYTLFGALGAPVLHEAWEPLLMNGPLKVSAFAPAPALSNALAAAAAGERVGETVLLALLMLGDVGPEGADGAAHTQSIHALRAIGLEKEARALAVEAALGHGI